MVKYPIYSRVQLTKTTNQEFNAVTGRLGSVVELRKRDLDNESEWKLLKDAYFVRNCDTIVRMFKNSPLTYNDKATNDWIANRPDATKIAKELRDMLDEGFSLHPLNVVKVHGKLESLLKENPTMMTKEQQVRIIVWQAKAIAAIYSPIFIEAKKRLKQLLRPEIIYTDGYRPDELSNRLRLLQGENIKFVEDDLTKQDRQTDNQMLDMEMFVYLQLGVDYNVVSAWREVHKNWRLKGKLLTGSRDAMRTTGQATTALGNAIVNLLCHSRFVQMNKSTIKLCLILGDDNLMLGTQFQGFKDLRRNIEMFYNMQSKSNLSLHHGTFCSLVAYKRIDGTCEFGPDWVRLKRRFEIPNGVHEVAGENLEMRSMSYAMMIGALPAMTKVVQDRQWPINLSNWYEEQSLVMALMDKYGMSSNEIYDNLNQLLTNMQNPTLFMHNFLTLEDRGFK